MDGATHAEARMAGSRVAHTDMALYMRRPWIFVSRGMNPAVIFSENRHRWVQH